MAYLATANNQRKHCRKYRRTTDPQDLSFDLDMLHIPPDIFVADVTEQNCHILFSLPQTFHLLRTAPVTITF